MKTYKISRSSWHYRLTSRLGSETTRARLHYAEDACDYLGIVLSTLAWTLVAIFAISFLFAVLVLLPIVASGTHYLGWNVGLAPDDIQFGVFLAACWLGLALLALLIFIAGVAYHYADKYRRYRRLVRRFTAEDEPESFIVLALRRVKDKTCTKIEIVD